VRALAGRDRQILQTAERFGIGRESLWAKIRKPDIRAG